MKRQSRHPLFSKSGAVAREISPSGNGTGNAAVERGESGGLPQEEVQRRSCTMGLLQTTQGLEPEQPE